MVVYPRLSTPIFIPTHLLKEFSAFEQPGQGRKAKNNHIEESSTSFESLISLCKLLLLLTMSNNF